MSGSDDAIAVPSFRNDHKEADDRIMYLKKLSLLLLTQAFLYVLSTISTNWFIVAYKKCGLLVEGVAQHQDSVFID